MSKLKIIPNPSKFTPAEEKFIKGIEQDKVIRKTNQKLIFSSILISMPEDFVDELKEYLARNPTEGRRSNFIVRVVAEYIQNKSR